MDPLITHPATATAALPATAMAMASLALPVLLASLGTSIANVGLPVLVQAFGATLPQVQWVVLAYLLAVTTVVVSVGRLADLVGPRRLLLWGLALFAAASLLCGLATTLWMLIAARAVQGTGAAVMMAVSMALVAAAVPKGKTGSAIGLLGTMSATGTALGPTLGGLLVAGAGWQSIFLVQAPLAIAAWLLAYRCLPADRAAKGKAPFDFLGSLLFALTLGAYALAMTTGRGSHFVVKALLLALSGAGVALFVLTQARNTTPLIPLALLRAATLRRAFAMSALATTVVMATLIVGPFYLADTLGLDTVRVGLVMSCGPVVAALAGIPSGRLADRYGTRRMLLAGLVAMTAGCAALAMLPVRMGVPGYVAPLAVITAGYAMFQTANNSALMCVSDARERGVVSGLLNLSRNLGLITGASLMGAVFASGGRLAFLLAMALSAAGLAIALLRRA
jgi:EmrB/QacA subfamily drug resistance transporter